MSVREILGAVGSWDLEFTEIPDDVRRKLDFFGHIVVLAGDVDVALYDDRLLSEARYVGILRRNDKSRAPRLGGFGMVGWLGDEDDKGQVFEQPVNAAGLTIGAAVAAVLPDALQVGTVFENIADTYGGPPFRYVSPRKALQTIADSFGREFRVNGDGTVDVGTPAQLYPSEQMVVIQRRGAGVDANLTAIGGEVETATSVEDYSDRVVLVGSSTETGTFAVGARSAPSVPYSDLFGNPVRRTRLISESGETTASVDVRSQLYLNRFARIATSLKVSPEDYELGDGVLRIGHDAYVYDPEAGVFDPAQRVYFRGEWLNPAVIRITEHQWPVTRGHTVAFRTGSGEWLDLTAWVKWETGGTQVTVGDLPRTLTNPPSNPVLDRADALPDQTVPNPPTNLQLTTTSVVNPRDGKNSAVISASWSPPAANTDGTPAGDISYYVVHYRWAGRAPLWETVTVDAPVVDIQAAIDLDYDVEVAAVDRSGNTSEFTDVLSIHTAADQTAPPPPATPAVGSYLGLLRVITTGVDADGDPMPPDTDRVDVEISPAGAGTWTVVSSVSPWIEQKALADTPYGVPYDVRLIAYDRTGNASAPSDVVTGASAQAADGDIAGLNVGKLVSGIVTADVIVGGQIATALTGQRSVMDALGFHSWNSANVQTVNLDGLNNLLTGVLQTALTGRRLVIGAAGATGQITFYAPDGSTAYVRAFTENTGIEALQFGVPITGATSSLWNKINYNTDEWASYRSGNHDFYMRDDGFFSVRSVSDGNVGATNVARLFIDVDSLVYYNTAQLGQLAISDANVDIHRSRFTVTPFEDNTSEDGWFQIKRTEPGHGSTTSSALATFINPSGFGVLLKHNAAADGSNGRIEVRDVNDNGYAPIFASAFTVSSDRRKKTKVRDLEVDPETVLRSMRWRSWEPRNETIESRRHGLVAQDLEANPLTAGLVVHGGGETEDLGVDLMGTVAVIGAALQSALTRIERLETA